MTPAQCRAARGLLNWNQDDLAKAASVSSVTVRNFENERSVPQRATLGVMRAALESAGVEFTNGGRPGVRMKATSIAMPQWAFEKGLGEFVRDILPQFEGLRIERPSLLSAVLVLNDREIATVSQHHGMAFFDPVPRDEGVVTAGAANIFGDWAGIAYRRAAEPARPTPASIPLEGSEREQ